MTTNLQHVPFAYHSTDSGFCRVYYTRQINGARHLYALQEISRGEFELFSCSKDGEPSGPIRPDAFAWQNLPLPMGDTSTDDDATKFLAVYQP